MSNEVLIKKDVYFIFEENLLQYIPIFFFLKFYFCKTGVHILSSCFQIKREKAVQKRGRFPSDDHVGT